ncbi:hypothetical protein [Embleya sp. MST-111070]|uniref:hypothetical protein n=1 Tax=Embleya sp. MST-111070 TaxID=3398231 RepID=UPI003F7377B8
MSSLKRRTAGLLLTATAALGVVSAAASPAQAGGGVYVATYRYLYECQNEGNLYMHYMGATSYSCPGNGANGFSLYVYYAA